MVPKERLHKALVEAGAPTTPLELEWDMDAYRQATLHAHFVRNRFTFLDLAYLTGKVPHLYAEQVVTQG